MVADLDGRPVALVRWVAERARRSGAARVVLDVKITDSRAVAQYERHGFCDIGPTPQTAEVSPERSMAAVLGSRATYDAVPGR